MDLPKPEASPQPAAPRPPVVDMEAAWRDNPAALARLCILATLEAAPRNARPTLEVWVEGVAKRRRHLVLGPVSGKVDAHWAPAEGAPPEMTRLRVWVDEVWRELGRRGLDLQAVQAEFRASVAARRAAAVVEGGQLAPAGQCARCGCGISEHSHAAVVGDPNPPSYCSQHVDTCPAFVPAPSQGTARLRARQEVTLADFEPPYTETNLPAWATGLCSAHREPEYHCDICRRPDAPEPCPTCEGPCEFPSTKPEGA